MIILSSKDYHHCYLNIFFLIRKFKNSNGEVSTKNKLITGPKIIKITPKLAK